MDGSGDRLMQAARAVHALWSARSFCMVLSFMRNAGCERLGPEEGEKRPELVLDDKRVAIAFSTCGERERLAFQEEQGSL